MKIYHIVAVAKNNVIGKDNKIPWKNSHDMRRFKELTYGHAVLMGRKTWESIPEAYRPLEGRFNMVLSRTIDDIEHEDVEVCSSIDDALNSAREKGQNELYIMGGEEVYRQTMDIVHEIRMTVIEEEYEGDAFYPDLYNFNGKDSVIWNRSYTEDHDGYHFKDYVRDFPIDL